MFAAERYPYGVARPSAPVLLAEKLNQNWFASTAPEVLSLHADAVVTSCERFAHWVIESFVRFTAVRWYTPYPGPGDHVLFAGFQMPRPRLSRSKYSRAELVESTLKILAPDGA